MAGWDWASPEPCWGQGTGTGSGDWDWELGLWVRWLRILRSSGGQLLRVIFNHTFLGFIRIIINNKTLNWIQMPTVNTCDVYVDTDHMGNVSKVGKQCLLTQGVTVRNVLTAAVTLAGRAATNTHHTHHHGTTRERPQAVTLR